MPIPVDLDFSRVSIFDIPPDYVDQRIDNFLLTLFKGVPSSRVYRIIRKGEVRVNRKRVKPQYRLCAHDTLRLPPMRVAEPGVLEVPGGLRVQLASAVIYEDDGLLIIDKPAGLAVHGGSGLKLGLIEALRETRGEAGLELVHRLDRDTSGCLLVARRRSALRHLHAEMRAGRIDKTYTALALGDWPRNMADVRAPLLKNHLSSGERMVTVSAAGKSSHTRFRVLRRYRVATLLAATPLTGRTHQIRVHARFCGCPLVGDDKYGDREAERKLGPGRRRLFLHASRLGFSLPDSGRRLEVEAPLADALVATLKQLGESSFDYYS